MAGEPIQFMTADIPDEKVFVKSDADTRLRDLVARNVMIRSIGEIVNWLDTGTVSRGCRGCDRSQQPIQCSCEFCIVEQVYESQLKPLV